MNQLSNTKDASNAILAVAELADQLKNLYFNRETADEKIIAKLENQCSELKMDIIDWFKDSANYELFKSSHEAKHALFFKQVQAKFYNNEIGINHELKDKIYRDFLKKFESTPPEDLITTQEKRNIQLNQNTSEEEFKSGFALAEATFLLNVYARVRCFESNWKYLQNHLPGKDLLDTETLSVLKTIQNNPHFLKDHPNHFLKNKGSYTNQAPTLGEVFDTVHASALASPDAKVKIRMYEKLFKDFTEKKPEQEIILDIRDKSKPKNSLGNDAPKLT